MSFSKILADQFTLIILWLLYFSIHSLLASLWFKQFVASHYTKWMPAYRLVFNIVSILLLLPPVYFMYRYPGTVLWQWSGGWKYVSYLFTFAALAGFLWSLKFYESGEFLGSSQLREKRTEIRELEKFSLSPLHRYVRHPWYAIALMFIWSRDMNEAFFVSACLFTLYFIIGSRLEEKKLITYHGQPYRTYQKKVSALVPLPWRILSRQQAAEILNENRHGDAVHDS